MQANKCVRSFGVSIVTLVFIGFFGGSTALTKAKYDFTYYKGYQAGLDAARTADKPILLDFYFDT